MKSLLALAATAAIIVAGCTSSSTNPPGDIVSFLAAKQGTYILGTTEYYMLNQSGGDSLVSSYNDSTVYSGQTTSTDTEGLSMSAANYISYISGVPTDTTLYAENGSKLYSLFDLNFELPGISPMMMGTRWVQIGDQTASSWTGLKDTVSGLDVNYKGIALTVDAAFDLQGSKIGNETLTIDGASVKAMRFKTSYTIAFTISSLLGSIPVSPLVIPIDYWVVEGVGVVKIVQKATPLTLGPPASQTIVIPGLTFKATKFVKAS